MDDASKELNQRRKDGALGYLADFWPRRAAGAEEHGRRSNGLLVQPLAGRGERIGALDGLRGLAALLVLAFAFTCEYDLNRGHAADTIWQVPWGSYGVLLFFVLSGFVAPLSLSTKTRAGDFLVARIARLVPAYWVAVGLTLLLMPLWAPKNMVDFDQAVLNFSMIQEWLEVEHVDRVYEVLTVELAFYAITLFVFAIHQSEHLERFCATWLVLQLATAGLEYIIGGEAPAWIVRSLALRHANLFATGMMFYKMRFSRPRLEHHVIVWLCLAIQHATIWSLRPMDSRSIGSTIAVAVIILAFYAYLNGGERIMAWRPLAFLGGISYALYLLHHPVGFSTLGIVQGWGVSTGWSILAALAATVIAALLLTYLIERPASRAIRNHYRRVREGTIYRAR